MDIGKSIRIACAMNDIKQKDLARLANVSAVTISHTINKKHACSSKNIELFAKAFGMRVSEFIALGEEKPA